MIKLITQHPIAYESPDYLEPWGTMRDNSQNKKFNKKLKRYFRKELKVLDLGCSGGGFVKSILKMGDLAVGIEGGDYSQKNQRAEWRKIPKNLFTADITKPFTIEKDGEKLKFDAITLWEVIEHIKEEDLKNLFENINNHLEEKGLVIGSISTKEEIINGTKLHQTVQSREWWLDWFKNNGWHYRDDLVAYFGEDWVRGFMIDDIYSFNFVIEK